MSGVDPIWNNNFFLGWEKESKKPLGFKHIPEPITDFSTANLSPNGQPAIEYREDRHLMCVAPTRSGKGRGLVIPNLLTYSGPVVVFDPKGELYNVTARRRREQGQKVIKLDPFRLIDSESDGLNPFDLFNLPNADVESDSQTLAEWLSLGNKGMKDPFWDLNGCGLISGLVTYAAGLEPAKRNLGTVFDVMMGDDAVYQMAVILDTFGKTMLPFAKAEIAAFLAMSERDTRPGVLATANSYIKPMLSRRVRDTFSRSSFSLKEVIDGEPLSIYIVMPPDKIQSHKAILKMWLGTLLAAVISRKHVPKDRTLFVIDECGQIGNFQFLETILTLCGGYGLSCWTIWQDLDQLSTAYDKSWRTLINNCAVLQTFGLSNRQAASLWSSYLQSSTDELMKIPADDQMILIEGRKEIISRRGDYLNDPMFKGLFDDNTMYMPSPGTNEPTPAKQAPKAEPEKTNNQTDGSEGGRGRHHG